MGASCVAIERHGYFLRSERLGFRLWGSDDLDLAMGLWGDPLVTRLIDSRGQLPPRRLPSACRRRSRRARSTASSTGRSFCSPRMST